MKPTWKIRKATIDDAVNLQRCMQAAYEIYQQRMQGKHLPPMNIDYATEIAGYPTWVVDLDNNIIGGLIMVFEDGHASIANIAVDPKYQGQSVGSGLIKFAVEKAREQKYVKMRLATHALLAESLSLYKHLGWVEVDRDSVRVTMEKNI